MNDKVGCLNLSVVHKQKKVFAQDAIFGKNASVYYNFLNKTIQGKITIAGYCITFSHIFMKISLYEYKSKPTNKLLFTITRVIE